MKSARIFRRSFLSLIALVATGSVVAPAQPVSHAAQQLNGPTGPAQKTIEIEDFNFDIEQVVDEHGRAGSAGKEKFNPFQVTRKSDQTSPMLVQAANTGEVFQIIVLDTKRRGKRVKVELHDVTISGYQRTGETERLTLHPAYGQIAD